MALTLDMATDTSVRYVADHLADTLSAFFISGGVTSQVTAAVVEDATTGKHYALGVQDGHMALLEVSDTTTTADVLLPDVVTGLVYKVTVSNGTINIEEA